MKPENFRQFIHNIGNSQILTTNRKYFLEAAIVLAFCILAINWISPQTNALYFLLIFPAIFFAVLLFYLIAKILQRPEFGFAVIALFLPFERIGALATSDYNIRLSQIFILITFIAYVLFYLYKSKDKFGGIEIKRDLTFVIIILFSVVQIVSLSGAANKARSIEVLGFDLFIFFAYIFLSNLLVSKDILKKIIVMIFSISIVISMYGLFQFVAGTLNLPLSISGLEAGYSTIGSFNFPRVQATESEPQFWGNFLLIPIALSLSIILASFGKKLGEDSGVSYKLLFGAIITFILAMVNLLLTFSRGAWYATGFIFILLIFFYIRKFLTLRVVMTLLVSLVILVGGLVFVLSSSKSTITLQSLTDRATQVEDADRDLTSSYAIQFFQSHPVLGVGVGSFGPLLAPNIYQQPNAYGQSIGWRIVNNEYLEILAETGLVGMAVFALFLIVVIRNILVALYKQTDYYTHTILLGLGAAFGAMLIQYIAFSTLYITQVWFLFALVEAVAFNITTNSWKSDSTPSTTSTKTSLT